MTPPNPPAGSHMALWLGTWSGPSDRPAQAALALGVALFIVALVPQGPGWLGSMVDLANVADRGRRRRFLTIASFFAAFLSLGYIAFYLRGGPRAPEASAYWLQGRALSHGALAWTAPEPSASFRGRNLLFVVPDRLSGIFPPGYPLLLAMGFLVGAPMLVGPLVAAALVVATWLLAHELCAGEDVEPANAEATARLAAGLSVVSAGLRYHTADALPYGVTGVGVAVSLACALRARRTGDVRLFGAAGLAVGALIASCAASALAVGAVVAGLAAGSPRPGARRGVLWALGGALPGLLLLLVANRAATGHAFASPVSVYSAAVRDAVSADGTTLTIGHSILLGLRRHLLDVVNVEPLALLAVVPLLGSAVVSGGRTPGAVPTALVVLGQMSIDALLRGRSALGSVGGGPALLVGVVPLEHALIALGVARLFPRAFSAAAVAIVALTLAGFALHASHAHEALAASDVGRPRFEPDVLREANVTHGLLFFDDDTGYELAYEPGVGASHGIQAARLRGDDHDRLLYDSLGHPAVHRYIAAGASATAAFWTPPNGGSDAWRFEAESDWPPVAPVGGSADAVDAAGASGCASDGRVLRVTPTGGREATVTLPLPIPGVATLAERRSVLVTPRVVQHGDGGEGAIELVTEPGQPPLAEWSWSDATTTPTCVDLPMRSVELRGETKRAWLIVRARRGPVMFDRTIVRSK
jgi:hypothetical protein